MSHLDEGVLHAMLDGEIESAELRAIEAHLAGCGTCGARLEEARRFKDESLTMITALDSELGTRSSALGTRSSALGTRSSALGTRRSALGTRPGGWKRLPVWGRGLAWAHHRRGGRSGLVAASRPIRGDGDAPACGGAGGRSGAGGGGQRGAAAIGSAGSAGSAVCQRSGLSAARPHGHDGSTATGSQRSQGWEERARDLGTRRSALGARHSGDGCWRPGEEGADGAGGWGVPGVGEDPDFGCEGH